MKESGSHLESADDGCENPAFQAAPILHVAKPSDAPSLARLAEKTFREAFGRFINKADFETYVAHSFNEKQIRSELLDRASTFIIANLKNMPVGYAKLYRSTPPDCVKQLPSIELARLYCLQQFWGSGIGVTLLEACINEARDRAFKSIWLSSWQENHRGNKFYAKMRFEVVGTKTFAVGSDIQEDFVYARPIR